MPWSSKYMCLLQCLGMGVCCSWSMSLVANSGSEIRFLYCLSCHWIYMISDSFISLTRLGMDSWLAYLSSKSRYLSLNSGSWSLSCSMYSLSISYLSRGSWSNRYCILEAISMPSSASLNSSSLSRMSSSMSSLYKSITSINSLSWSVRSIRCVLIGSSLISSLSSSSYPSPKAFYISWSSTCQGELSTFLIISSLVG